MLSAKTKRSTNRIRQALKIAAMSLSHNGSALGALSQPLVPADGQASGQSRPLRCPDKVSHNDFTAISDELCYANQLE